jgi:hypothetical protein
MSAQEMQQVENGHKKREFFMARAKNAKGAKEPPGSINLKPSRPWRPWREAQAR